MNVKIELSSPELLFTIGVVIVKTEPDGVLKNRWVVSEKLIQVSLHV